MRQQIGDGSLALICSSLFLSTFANIQGNVALSSSIFSLNQSHHEEHSFISEDTWC